MAIRFKSQIPDNLEAIETFSQEVVTIGADEKVNILNDKTNVIARRKRKNHLVIKLIQQVRIRYKPILREKQNLNHVLIQFVVFLITISV